MIESDSLWGSIGELIKTFHFTKSYILWGDSWINIQLMITDMSFYDYDAINEKVYSYETDAIDEEDDIEDFLNI